MARLGLGAALLADAGLNLNNGAFQNLRAAAENTGFLSGRGLICEVYPATVRPDHLEFLRAVGNPYVGVGLQSTSTLPPSWPASSENTTKPASRKRYQSPDRGGARRRRGHHGPAGR